MHQSVVLFGLGVASLALYACLGEHPGVSSEATESQDSMTVETTAMADQTNATPGTPASGSVPENWAELAREDWKRILTDEQYTILREAGTERPFSGKYWKDNGGDTGVFKCNVCLQPLFTRESKFFSSCGWPAFKAEVDGRVAEHDDTSHGMVRTEVRCHNCDSHLGHVFNDGPPPTGLRYCINSECIVYDEDGTVADKPVTPAERLRIAEQEGQTG